MNSFRALVGSLLKTCRPTTICRLIVPIRINPIDRKPQSWFSHIGEKGLEFRPTITNGDPSAAVVFEHHNFRVAAALMHVLPAAINATGFALTRMTMRGLSAFHTAARSACAVAEIATSHASKSAAITAAYPIPFPVVLNGAYRQPVSKTLIGDIPKGGHWRLLHERLCQVVVRVFAHSGRRVFCTNEWLECKYNLKGAL